MEDNKINKTRFSSSLGITKMTRRSETGICGVSPGVLKHEFEISLDPPPHNIFQKRNFLKKKPFYKGTSINYVTQFIDFLDPLRNTKPYKCLYFYNGW
jgi:hypothetical protein